MKNKNKMQLAFIVIAVSLVILGCKKQEYQQPSSSPTSSGSPGTNEVWIQNYAFNPSSITVPANATIKWTNKDAVAHTATSNSGVFDSGSINDGGVYSYHFTAPGTYAYHCTLHPHMTATIIVQ